MHAQAGITALKGSPCSSPQAWVRVWGEGQSQVSTEGRWVGPHEPPIVQGCFVGSIKVVVLDYQAHRRQAVHLWIEELPQTIPPHPGV